MNLKKPILKINNIWSTIEDLPRGADVNLYNEISYEVPNVSFVKLYYPGWDGRKHLFIKSKSKKKRNCGKFLTGLTSTVIEILHRDFGIVPTIVDERKKPEKNLFLDWNYEKFPLRDYQLEVIKNGIEKGRGVFEIATGGGKTIIAAKTIQEIGVSPFIFYVLTKELMTQAKKRIESAIPNIEVGIVGDGICEIKDVNIMTIQTAIRCFGNKMEKSEDLDEDEMQSLKEEDMSHVAKKREDIRNLIENSKGIYFDEVHHCPAATCQDVLTKSIQSYHMFGGSATPTRTDNADDVIQGLFGRKICQITASYLIRHDPPYLIRPDIFFIRMPKSSSRYRNFQEDYEVNVVQNEIRNQHIATIAETLSRNDLSVLILVQRINHGKILEKLIPGSFFISGKSAKSVREKTLRQLELKKLKICIATTIGDEGLDIPTLNSVIIAGGFKSPTKAKQRVGRTLRLSPGKETALVFDFLDVGRWTSKHAKERMKILKTEPEFRIMETNEFSSVDGDKYRNLF